MGFAHIEGREEMLLKGDSALLVNKKPFFVPEETIRLAAHPCIVLRICKLGKNISPRFAHRYIDAFAAGLHLEDEGALKKAIAEGHSWLPAVAADGSFPVGTFLPLSDGEPLTGVLRYQSGEEEKSIAFSDQQIAEAIAQISRVITIRQGDMLFLTSEEAPFYPAMDQAITALIGEEENLYCKIK